MKALAGEDREAIAFLLGRVPELIGDELEDSESLDGLFKPWIEFLSILTSTSLMYAAIHQDEDVLQAARTVSQALTRLRALGPLAADWYN